MEEKNTVKAHEKHEAIDGLFAGVNQQYEGYAARSYSAEHAGLVEKRTREKWKAQW